MDEEHIYLDFNATTPIDEEVQRAIIPYLTTIFGNPSSGHIYGKAAKEAVVIARLRIASLIGCDPDEVYFTGNGTESNNTAIKGAAFANQKKGKHIITTNVEHPAVHEVCKYLEGKGFEVTYISVDETGRISSIDVENAIREDTIIISVMHANNEVGTVQPIEEIGSIARKRNILFHCDAAQSVGKIATKVNDLNVDLMTIVGHKIYAPKGIGALYVRNGTALEKLLHGANHERNLRGGTENILGIVGLGTACMIAERDFEKNYNHLCSVTRLLKEELLKTSEKIVYNGNAQYSLPNTISVSFPHIKANELVALLSPYVCVSAGAACHAETVSISSVLKAMNVPSHIAMGTIRLSTGRTTTKEQVLKAVEVIHRRHLELQNKA